MGFFSISFFFTAELENRLGGKRRHNCFLISMGGGLTDFVLHLF
jgi:hypothetical protein